MMDSIISRSAFRRTRQARKCLVSGSTIALDGIRGCLYYEALPSSLSTLPFAPFFPQQHHRRPSPDSTFSGALPIPLPAPKTRPQADRSASPQRSGPPVDIAELKQKSVAELHALAEQLNITNYSGLRKQDLIFRIEQSLLDQDTVIRGEGVLGILPEGYGFLRSQDWNYLYGPDDIYVSPSQIKRFDLRTGDTVMGQVRPPKEGERYLALLKVENVNFEEPEKTKHRIAFDNLRPGTPSPGSAWSGKTATSRCGWSTRSLHWARGSAR